jgi:hypothetical protein
MGPGVTVGRNHDGRLEAFWLHGTEVRHRWQTAPNSGWSDSGSLGGWTQDAIAVGVNGDGRLELFVTNHGKCSHVWEAVQGGWSGWAKLGTGLAGSPAVQTNRDGRLEVFARAANNTIRHAWQTAPNGGWSSWESLGGGTHNDIAVGVNANGRLKVFVINDHGNCSHTWQAPSGGWSGWANLGTGLAGSPAVQANQDGRLEVFAFSKNGAIMHAWQIAPNGSWSQFEVLEPPPSPPQQGSLLLALGAHLQGQNDYRATVEDGILAPQGAHILAVTNETRGTDSQNPGTVTVDLEHISYGPAHHLGVVGSDAEKDSINFRAQPVAGDWRATRDGVAMDDRACTVTIDWAV